MQRPGRRPRWKPMRKLTAEGARKMGAARKTYGGGPKKIPTPCPKCQTPCASVRQAIAHCD